MWCPSYLPVIFSSWRTDVCEVGCCACTFTSLEEMQAGKLTLRTESRPRNWLNSIKFCFATASCLCGLTALVHLLAMGSLTLRHARRQKKKRGTVEQSTVSCNDEKNATSPNWLWPGPGRLWMMPAHAYRASCKTWSQCMPGGKKRRWRKLKK